MKPTVYLLCGLPGSGKTTYAKKLSEKEAAIRLTLDEELFKRFGKEFEPSLYSEYEKRTKEELAEILKEAVGQNKSVILDFGFWKKAERDSYKQLIEGLDANWAPLYFKRSKGELLTRLSLRNQDGLENNHVISPQLLEKFIDEFEAPVGEEEIIR